MPSTNNRSSLGQLLLSGVDRSRTLRALALAVGLGIATAALRLGAPGSPGVGLVFGLLHAFTLEATPAAMLTEGVGVVTMLGLAAIHGYWNKGYVPSLLVAALPSYGAYVFNGPGAAPVWAAGYVLPFALTVGTLGFLIGVGARWARGEGRPPVPAGSLIG